MSGQLARARAASFSSVAFWLSEVNFKCALMFLPVHRHRLPVQRYRFHVNRTFLLIELLIALRQHV